MSALTMQSHYDRFRSRPRRLLGNVFSVALIPLFSASKIAFAVSLGVSLLEHQFSLACSLRLMHFSWFIGNY
jgi:hypothetical protein